jgi:hypothetical protein
MLERDRPALDSLSWLTLVLDHVLTQGSNCALFLANCIFEFMFELYAGRVIPCLESIKFQGCQLGEVAKHVFRVGIEAVEFRAIGHIDCNLQPLEMRSFVADDPRVTSALAAY